MLRISALMITTYCIAFVLTSVVAAPDRLRASVAMMERVLVGLFEAAASESAASESALSEGAAATPGAVRSGPREDALAPPFPPPPLGAPASVFAEIALAPSGAIVARDDSGRIVFAHDPGERTTVVSRGVVPPRLSMGPTTADPRLDVVPNPVAPEPRPETRPESPPRNTTVPPGCESAVGPLADADAPPRPVLCLARL